MSGVSLCAVPNLPLIQPGDDLAKLIVSRLAAVGQTVLAGDILIIAQKVVSKAEGRLVRVADIAPDEEAERIAETVGKDPRVVQIVLNDSNEVIRTRRGLLVVEQKSGWVCANAGVDRSNVAATESGDDMLALLPADADASAARIRQGLLDLSGLDNDAKLGVLINDSHGRAWRVGTVGVCIGCAGLPALWNQNGLHDLYGYELHASEECIADELCAAASLIMGQSNEGAPVVIIRGYQPPPHLAPTNARVIQRPAAMDVFR
jgi:coenzyme F420-0:L-glutamate ligase/coenzyme F420-1:gamma-L-glutamate ligase